MAQLVVRNLEQSVKTSLQKLANRHGRSMEEEVRSILRDAVKGSDESVGGLGSEIAAIMKGTGLKFEAEELRGFPVKPASFDE